MVVQRVLLGGWGVEFTVTYHVLHHVDMVEFAAFDRSEHDDGAGDLQWKGCSGHLAAMVGVGGVGVGPDAAAPRLVVKSCIGGLVLVDLVGIAKIRRWLFHFDEVMGMDSLIV